MFARQRALDAEIVTMEQEAAGLRKEALGVVGLRLPTGAGTTPS